MNKAILKQIQERPGEHRRDPRSGASDCRRQTCPVYEVLLGYTRAISVHYVWPYHEAALHPACKSSSCLDKQLGTKMRLERH